MTVFCDFETRSACNLPLHGVYNYAQDGSTEALCLSYAFDDGEVQLWLPGQPLPDFSGHQIRARNAAFERLIFWYVLHQNYPLEQFYCTAAQAAANCLPRSLEDNGRALSSKMRKDHRGTHLVRECCIPPYNTDLLPELYEYCKQDVRADRDQSKTMRDLTATELADYHANERINDRGVLVDLALCKAAVRYSAVELKEVQAIFTEITGLASIRSPKMRLWVQERVGPQALELMTRYKDGVKKMSVDKSVRANLLLLHGDDQDEVSEDVAEVLMCADDVWASSVAKFSRLAQLADEEDGRVRGAFVFNGGSATGRASSYGAQVHNFTRKCADAPRDVREAMVRGESLVPKFGRRITDVLKGMLRPALIPARGNVFAVADWAGIEARVNPWMAKSAAGEQKLDLFRRGEDVYIENAKATFRGQEIDKDKRQIGKVQELACGFGGGKGAFGSMARNYGLLMSEYEQEKMVKGWRIANPWAIPYWQDLEEAYTRAIRNKGHEFSAGRVTYLFDGRHLWYALPSGRILCYTFAKLDNDGLSYSKSAWKPAADAAEWPRARLWRGLACENITQAGANDLLRHSLRQLDCVVLHVHDEIVLEVPENEAPSAAGILESIMIDPPSWASGLPLAVEVKIMERYGK